MSGSTVTDIARLGQSFSGSQQPDSSGTSWSGGSWAQQLQPGPWRGVGFVLDAGDTAAGRRVAIHEYPYRDTAWAEDLGKLPRRFSIQAYLTGDDVYQQRDAMVAACEQPGPGTLVHPTLGSIQCVLLEFQVTDRRERGRYIEVQFSFILAGDVQFPSSLTATLQNVGAAIDGLNLASASDLGSALLGPRQRGRRRRRWRRASSPRLRKPPSVTPRAYSTACGACRATSGGSTPEAAQPSSR